MTSHDVLPRQETMAEVVPRPSVWRRALEWVLGIAGAIAVFVGAFIQFAGEDQYLGILWIWSWRVGDISDAWLFGSLIVGCLLLAASFGLVSQRRLRVEQRATPATWVWLILTFLTLAAAAVFAFAWLI